mgnify:CR=1 FL=1
MISKWFQLASYVSCINVSTNDEINYTTGLKKTPPVPKVNSINIIANRIKINTEDGICITVGY